MRHSSRTNYYEGSSISDDEQPTRRSTRVTKSRRITMNDYEDYYQSGGHVENTPPRKRRKISYNIRRRTQSPPSPRRYSLDDRYSLRNKENTDKTTLNEEAEEQPLQEQVLINTDLDPAPSDSDDDIPIKSRSSSGKLSLILSKPKSPSIDPTFNEEPQIEDHLDLPHPDIELEQQSNASSFRAPSSSNSSNFSIHSSSDESIPNNQHYSFRVRSNRSNRNNQINSELIELNESHLPRRKLRKKKQFKPFTDYQSTQQVLDILELQSNQPQPRRRRKINLTHENDSDLTDSDNNNEQQITQYEHKQTILRDLIQLEINHRNNGDNNDDIDNELLDLVEPPISWSKWFHNTLLKDYKPSTITKSPANPKYAQYYDYLARGPVALTNKKNTSMALLNRPKLIPYTHLAGLDAQLLKLKEMLILPLIYPDLYTNLPISPPRGILFSGLPGTGKTLLVRTLASQYPQITFYIKKGADILSKWVGEAEQQLTKLFTLAQATSPSIIFFDELDGLAPTRQSGSNTNHSASIVSTLLALMDGLDTLGNIILIGATNRVDAIDPALRRPGRFDHEMIFTLPNRPTRSQLLSIYTTNIHIHNKSQLISQLSHHTISYSGADIKSLCTTAMLNAIRRVYPNIYNSPTRLENVSFNQIILNQADFKSALQSTKSSIHRHHTNPILHPIVYSTIPLCHNYVLTNQITLLIGNSVNTTPISKYLLHTNPTLIQLLDPSTLFDPTSTPYAIINTIFQSCNTIIYIPNLNLWIHLLDAMSVDMLLYCIYHIQEKTRVLVSVTEMAMLPIKVVNAIKSGTMLTLHSPTLETRIDYWTSLIKAQLILEYITPHPVAIAPLTMPIITNNSVPTEHDEFVIRELRIALRSITIELIKDTQYKPFVKPIDPSKYPDYYAIIKHPLCLMDVLQKIDDGRYLRVGEYVDDIQVIISNCNQYNREYRIIGMGCLMMDVVVSMVSRINRDLLVECELVWERTVGDGVHGVDGAPLEVEEDVGDVGDVAHVGNETPLEVEEDGTHGGNETPLDVEEDVADLMEEADLMEVEQEEMQVETQVPAQEETTTTQTTTTTVHVTSNTKKRILYLVALLLRKTSEMGIMEMERIGNILEMEMGKREGVEEQIGDGIRIIQKL